MLRSARPALFLSEMLKKVVGKNTEAPLVMDGARHVGLQAVFTPSKIPFDEQGLTRSLQAYHTSLSSASFEMEQNNGDMLVGRATFSMPAPGNDADDAANNHVVEVIALNKPFPSDGVADLIHTGMYDEAVKQHIRDGKSSAMLYYKGDSAKVLERYVAVSVVAGALADCGAVGILNVNGRASAPASLFTKRTIEEHYGEGKTIDFFRDILPLSTIFCGFIKYKVDGAEGVWMHTCGAEVFQLPNLAVMVPNLDYAETVFQFLSAVLRAMVDGDHALQEGETMCLAADNVVSVRQPRDAEDFLKKVPGALVLEPSKGWR